MTGLQLAIGEQLAAAFVLAVARTAAFVLVTPPFNTRAVPAQARIALALALALPLTAPLQAGAPTLMSGELVLRLVLQIATGLALGFFVLIAVSAVQAAGDLVDLVGGFNSSIALDPLMLTQTSVFGRLHQFVAVAVLFATDGHLMIVQGLSRSLQAMPDPHVSWDALERALVADVTALVTGGLQIAAPIIAAMLVADVSLGLLTRAAPALNAFALAFPLKILFSLLLVGLVVVRLPTEVHDVVQHAVIVVLHLSGADAGSG
ncbi:MAG: flagellar biosynthetic protein FliR [Kineosporiaceae bacterium]